MSQENYALERCDAYGLSPEDAFKNQIMITDKGHDKIAGLTATELNGCTLHTGSDMKVLTMEDTKGRLYGAFVGVGIDRGGARVTAEGFRAFNSKSPLFSKTFAKFVGEIAGRFAVVLDVGKTRMLFTDPMGHMGLFYNPETQRAATAEYLTLDRAVEPGPQSGTVAPAPLGLSKSFPMGLGLDRDTRLLLGGHTLDLTSFEATRMWPANTSLRKVTRSKAGPVVEQMAKRLKTVVGALAKSQTCSMSLAGGLEDRLLLAALKASESDLAQLSVATVSGEDADVLDCTVAERAGYPLTGVSQDEARQQFASDPPQRQALKQLFWVRTGCALRVPREALVNLGGLRPQKAIALSGAGLSALQGGWTPQADVAPLTKPTLGDELEVLLGHAPEPADKTAFETPYKAWKSSLPKSFHVVSSDFVRLEMHEPAKAVAWHGEAGQFTVSPFSDRFLIEHALRLPAEMRAGPALIEALLEKLAPELANLPYPGQDEAATVHAAE